VDFLPTGWRRFHQSTLLTYLFIKQKHSNCDQRQAHILSMAKTHRRKAENQSAGKTALQVGGH